MDNTEIVGTLIRQEDRQLRGGGCRSDIKDMTVFFGNTLVKQI